MDYLNQEEFLKVKELIDMKIFELNLGLEEDSWTYIDDVKEREEVINEISKYQIILSKLSK